MYGAGGRLGYEEIWDKVLTAGLPIWGVAVDDSHHFKGEFGPQRINPGRGWVMVKAEGLDEDSLLNSLQAGDFYSSTGITLANLDQGPDGISLAICPDGDSAYTTRSPGTMALP